MIKTDCIDIELCYNCFSLPCECLKLNIETGVIRGKMYEKKIINMNII